jgi:hypothetical protein
MYNPALLDDYRRSILFAQLFMAEATKLPEIISFHKHLSASKRGMKPFFGLAK